MVADWVLPATGLAAMALAAAALVPVRGFLAGNRMWFALGWLASEFAPWLAALATAGCALLVRKATYDDAEPTRLAAMLCAAAAAGLFVAHRRARHARPALEAALREQLGANYPDRIPAPRRAVVGAASPIHPSPLSLPRLRVRNLGVERIANVPYPGGDERNTLDVYRPAAGCHDAPVLLQIHGGDWIGGDRRRQAQPLVHHLASLGWLVVTASYRLSPAARLPAHLIDCKSALAWIRGHAAALGGDPTFVAVSGGGAGAHLAALLALTFDQRDLQPGFEHVDSRPAACVALHGVYDLADRSHHFAAPRTRLRWLGTHVMPSAAERDPLAWDLVSPLARVRNDAPPFFVLHGTHDSLSPVAGARQFVSCLRSVSCEPVVYAELPGAHHGWDTLVTHRSLQTAQAVALFLEWCAARHFRERGPHRDSADRACS